MRFFMFLLMCLCVWGCGDEGLLLSEQVIESGLFEEGVVTDVPPAVWEWTKPDERYFKRRESFQLERKAYYTKYIDADGIAILAGARVADEYLIEARQVVLTMTAKHPALRDRLRVQHGFYLILYEYSTGYGDTSAVPEQYNERQGYYREQSTCNMAVGRWGDEGAKGYCTAAVGEAHFGRMYQVVHEFAHALDSEIQYLKDRTLLASGVPLNEAYNSNREFFDQLEQAYQQAKASDTYRNLWDPYIITENSHEYWAEGVHIWFYGIGEGREFETYETFAAVDPLLYELLSEWFYRGAFPRDPIPGVPQYEIMWDNVNVERR